MEMLVKGNSRRGGGNEKDARKRTEQTGKKKKDKKERNLTKNARHVRDPVLSAPGNIAYLFCSRRCLFTFFTWI